MSLGEMHPMFRKMNKGGANPEILKSMEDFEKRRIENKERKKAALSVGLNKERLSKEIEESQYEEGKDLLRLFSRLPENLEFIPGKTLIVGENGSGKSTLAKALFLAYKKAKTADDYRDDAVVFRDEEGFKNADELARKSVFEPTAGYWEEWRRQRFWRPLYYHYTTPAFTRICE